ncbi:T9SS type B sorting domain-containing protein [Dyadobacter bucti]|uniref:T9SS type B sorting domain-containing protein n=1 Tax=Dyadobacter bucti TaxID=2572203 RepID=UPI001108702F|nr:gliding motility-associated C-terminal domain-containing protein [Dyadobacter bucti]
MKKGRRLLAWLLLILLCGSGATGQSSKRENRWYFGTNAGLDFSNGTATPLTDGALRTLEGTATMCDENGELLFYTDGSSIWNKAHEPMPDATGLGGNTSTSQAAVIIPQPEHPDRYFVFSVAAKGGPGGLQYAVVDMNMNEGLGGIVSKNHVLLARVSEKLTALRHCNNTDFWVIAHETGNNSFRSFQVTREGVNEKSVESITGSIHQEGLYAIGYMKASQDGRTIALARFDDSAFEIFRFDSESGLLSEPVYLKHPDFENAYGLEFSPDSKYLYLSAGREPPRIFRVSLPNSYSLATIIGSKVILGSIPGSFPGAMQLGPDGKIYVAAEGQGHLGVINHPMQKAEDVGFSPSGIDLGGRKSQRGLPNFMISRFNPGACMARPLAPDIFTPNNDGINDTFHVSVADGIMIRLDIYNKWGNLLYRDLGNNPHWDGKFNGADCPNDAYTYILKFKTSENERIQEYRGSVIIAR